MLRFHVEWPERLKNEIFDIKYRLELALNTGLDGFRQTFSNICSSFMKATIVPRTAFCSGQAKFSRLQYPNRETKWGRSVVGPNAVRVLIGQSNPYIYQYVSV